MGRQALPPIPENSQPLATNVQVAAEALPARIPPSDSEIWVTIQGAADDVVNVRSGPGTTYPVIGTIGAGKGLQVMAISADHTWLQFRYPHTVNGAAWIYTTLTDYHPEMGVLPEVEILPPSGT